MQAFLLVPLLAPDGEDKVAEHGVLPELPVALGHGRRGKVAEQGELIGVDILQQLSHGVFGLVKHQYQSTGIRANWNAVVWDKLSGTR